MRSSKLEINVLDSNSGSYKIKVIEHMDHGDILVSLPENVDWEHVDPIIRKIINLDLRYDNPIVLNKDVETTPLEPYAKRSVSNYTVLPDLPLGLELDPDTGVIRGTPLAGSLEKEYKLTASSDGILINFTCLISVIKPKPEDLSYILPEHLDLAKEFSVLPIVKGDVDYYKIDRELPEGLSFNEYTGEISGTPLKKLDKSRFTVEAYNDFGKDVSNINLSVKDIRPVFDLKENKHKLIDGTYFGIEPNITNKNIVRFEFLPSIPKGLEFDEHTGALSGVYLKQKKAKIFLEGDKHTITAYNKEGESYSKEIFLYLEENAFSLDHNILAVFMNKLKIKEVYPKKHSKNSYMFSYKLDGKKHIVRITNKNNISIEDTKCEIEWIKFLHSNNILIPQADKIIPLVEDYFAVTYQYTEDHSLDLGENYEDYYLEVGRILRNTHEVSRGFRPLSVQESFSNLKSENEIIKNIYNKIKEDFEELSKSSESYGMTHGSFNINTSCKVTDENKATISDFSECSLGWYIYDIISFYKSLEDNDLTTLVKKKIIDSFLKGYYGDEDKSQHFSWIKHYDLFNTWDLLRDYVSSPNKELLDKLNASGYMYE